MQAISSLFLKLQKLKTSYSPKFSDEKIKILNNIRQTTSFNGIHNITELHDLLLFLKTFPDNEKVENLVDSLLENMSIYVLDNYSKENVKSQLMNSGIAYSCIEANYNFDILRTLVNRYETIIGFDSFGGTEEDLLSVFNMLINEIEQSAFTDEDFDLNAWIEKSFSKIAQNKLNEIISLVEENLQNDKQKTEVFSKLGIYTVANLNKHFSRTFLRLPSTLVHKSYHETKGLEKKPPIQEIILKPLPDPVYLEKDQKKQLIDLAQVQLFCLLRELDALTYADENNVELIVLEDGYSIALYYQKIHKRSAIESLVGYMGFKNGVPYSYGAFWILGHSAKIAFNIFECFRGGESVHWFAQVLRILQNHFNIQHILVEPYQFGRNNEEAISSGAFWFYYKLGFRQKSEKLKTLAQKEFLKIAADSKYRISKKTIATLITEPLEYRLQSQTSPILSATQIAIKVSEMIQTQFYGNRIQIENKTTQKMLQALDIKILSSVTSLTETESFKKTSLIYYNIINKIQKWSASEKDNLFQLMVLKLSGNEREYVDKFQAHKKLMNDLLEMIEDY